METAKPKDTQALIKQRYIAAVKAFPPETHPEEFQKIRRAYEALREPLKRRENNLMRNYGVAHERSLADAGTVKVGGRSNSDNNYLLVFCE